MSGAQLTYRERWGFLPAVFASLYARLRTKLGLRIYGIHVRRVDPPTGPAPEVEGFSFRVFKEGEADALIACSRNSALDLPEDFVREALAKGDLCDVALCDGSVVSYGWTASTPTQEDDGVFVGFGEGYGYAYKSLTLPDYRGRHLFRITKPRRDRHFIDTGFCTRLIVFIALTNRSSRALTQAMGYERVGTAGYFKRGRLFWAFRSPGAKRHAFRFFMPARSTQT